MKKQVLYRIFFYVLGLLILALGLTLNTKAGLGVSPIISVSYSVSQIFTLNFGDTTMFLYCVFVLVQLILHAVQWKQHPETDQRLVLLLDVLQIPLSLVFTRFLNLFGAFFPDLSAGAAGWSDRFPLRLVVLLLAILFTGVGAAMSLSMRIVPNPGDGIVRPSRTACTGASASPKTVLTFATSPSPSCWGCCSPVIWWAWGWARCWR